MSKEWNSFQLTESRYSSPAAYDLGVKIMSAITLCYGKQPNVGWRFVVKQDGYHVVGLTYPTKEELLNDMPRYATTWGLN